jgi:hypothetical protein
VPKGVLSGSRKRRAHSVTSSVLPRLHNWSRCRARGSLTKRVPVGVRSACAGRGRFEPEIGLPIFAELYVVSRPIHNLAADHFDDARRPAIFIGGRERAGLKVKGQTHTIPPHKIRYCCQRACNWNSREGRSEDSKRRNTAHSIRFATAEPFSDRGLIFFRKAQSEPRYLGCYDLLETLLVANGSTVYCFYLARGQA